MKIHILLLMSCLGVANARSVNQKELDYLTRALETLVHNPTKIELENPNITGHVKDADQSYESYENSYSHENSDHHSDEYGDYSHDHSDHHSDEYGDYSHDHSDHHSSEHYEGDHRDHDFDEDHEHELQHSILHGIQNLQDELENLHFENMVNDARKTLDNLKRVCFFVLHEHQSLVEKRRLEDENKSEESNGKRKDKDNKGKKRTNKAKKDKAHSHEQYEHDHEPGQFLDPEMFTAICHTVEHFINEHK